ncbi:thioredoxin domain-containing protein, partial [Amylibacter sp.]|nr:thioredoxin domain-containing protein [Amylibacter sp.]
MKNIKPLYLIPPFIFFVLAIIMFIGLGRDNPNELPSQMVGREAPNLTIIPLSDLPFLDETDLKAPNIKIVNFWASWCAPCRVEHPNIQQLSDLGF